MQTTAMICHEARNYAPNGRTGLLDWLREQGIVVLSEPRHACARAPPPRPRRDARGRRAARASRATRRSSCWRPSPRWRAGCSPTRSRDDLDGLPQAARALPCRRRSTTAPRPRSCACSRRPEPASTVLPHDATAAQVEELAPDGVLLANGPGDPGSMHAHVAEVRAMVDQDRPLYGICLGHQLLGRALGLETFKLPFGHRGANHPVSRRESGRVLVTSQNHGFAVKAPENGDGGARGHAPLALRRHGRGPAPARPAGLEHAVPPRGVARAARRTREAVRVRRGLRRAGRGETADAPPRRSPHDRHHRLRPDRDRPGLRVRLLRRPGPQGAARGGLPHGPDQLESGHDHDRPGLGRRDLPRAARPRGRHGGSPQGAARRAAADARRPDGAQPRDGARARGRAGGARHRADRRLREGDPHGRGPRGVRRGHGLGRPARAAIGDRAHARRGARRDRDRAAAAGRDPPGVHARGPRRRLRAHGRGAGRDRAARPQRESRSRRSSSRSRSRAGASSSSR